ncbi:MAG: hypothetical protein ACE5EE_11415, partial [Fidelibacterota bacterium]
FSQIPACFGEGQKGGRSIMHSLYAGPYHDSALPVSPIRTMAYSSAPKNPASSVITIHIPEPAFRFWISW